RGDTLLPRARPADHRAVARIAHRQRLPVHALGKVLDQLLSGPGPHAHHHRDQPGGRPAARRAEPEARAMSEALLDVEGLRMHFFTRAGVVKAVDDATFSVERGRILGLVGESGSGKSMTGYSIMGLID